MSWPVLPHGFLGVQATGDNDTYRIERSLRFNDNDASYLSRTWGTPADAKKLTLSIWYKRANLGGALSSYGGSIFCPNNQNFVSIGGNAASGSDEIQILYSNAWLVISNAKFRDPSAWYHLVIAFDSTQSTAANRCRVYINGTEITSWSTDARSNIALNSNLLFNASGNNCIISGYNIGAGYGYYDGYLAEYNCIDGQALTPSDFGETDAITGRWKAKAYSGTYGTNGFYLPFSNNSGATATTLGKDNSTYRMLTAQLNGTSNGIQRGADLTGIANGKSGTVSMWWNFTGASSGFQPLWTSRNNSTIGTTLAVNRTATGTILVAALNSSGTTILYAETNSTVAASAGVYHIYATWDLAVNNQIKIYVNGVDQALTITTFTNATIQYSVPNHGLGGNLFNPFSPTTPGMVGQVYVNYSTYLDPATNIGKFYGGANTPVSLGSSGEIPTGSSPIVYLDGDATSILTNRGTGGNFAAYGTLSTGTTYSGTGVHYNNWTPNNFSVTAGAGNDSLVDSPTNYGTDTGVGGEVRGNYATWNPLDRGSEVVLANGNLDVTWSGVNGHSVRSTSHISSGKWYWEVICGANASIGIIQSNIVPALNGWVGQSTYGSGGSYAYAPDGRKVTNSSYSSFGTAMTNGNVVGVAYDADNGRIFFSLNGTWQASGNPSTGTNPAYSSITGTYSPAIGYWGTPTSNTNSVNFGQRPFAYTAPSGFKALCTTNLPQPTIQKPSSYMDVVRYTGTGATQSITGLEFSPDLLWIKNRTLGVGGNHVVFDSVRGGPSNELYPNMTSAESPTTGALQSLNSNGFTLSNAGDLVRYNNNTNQYVAWAWDAGSTNATNTSGAITSTVRSSPQSGMSILTYSGSLSGTGNATVGHGLGVAPAFWISKAITNPNSNDSGDWAIWHKNLNSNTILRFNTAAAQSTSGTLTQPTSSVFTTTWNSGLNVSGRNYIAYAFAEVEGFSRFGSYVGNNSTDGPFCWCGFRPKYILIKNITSSGAPWLVYDSVRSSFNVQEAEIRPNTSEAENGFSLVGSLDFLSNGFKIREDNNTSWLNTPSATFIFAAFAELPFKYARAR